MLSQVFVEPIDCLLSCTMVALHTRGARSCSYTKSMDTVFINDELIIIFLGRTDLSTHCSFDFLRDFLAESRIQLGNSAAILKDFGVNIDLSE